MPSSQQPRNRGPKAGPANRAALLAAARTLFGRDGYRVPVSLIAREAGVGQGVLYRHFPTRLELAYAVFDENFTALEEAAATLKGPDAFAGLWRMLIGYTVESTAFVDMVIDAREKLPDDVASERLTRLIERPMREAAAAGLADPSWTTDDLILVLHMVHGVVTANPDHRGAATARALGLIDRRLVVS